MLGINMPSAKLLLSAPPAKTVSTLLNTPNLPVQLSHLCLPQSTFHLYLPLSSDFASHVFVTLKQYLPNMSIFLITQILPLLPLSTHHLPVPSKLPLYIIF